MRLYAYQGIARATYYGCAIYIVCKPYEIHTSVSINKGEQLSQIWMPTLDAFGVPKLKLLIFLKFHVPGVHRRKLKLLVKKQDYRYKVLMVWAP